MADKQLRHSAEQIDDLLDKVESGGGGASPEQIQQIEQNAQAIESLQETKADKNEIPTKVSDLTDDIGYVTETGLANKGYLTGYTETDPTVPAWAKASTKPAYTASEVGAEPANAVSAHNASAAAHSDIRLLITELTNRLNAVANSTDTELDQLAELVAYIKDNRSLIEQVTTNKVNVADIINNLTTNVSNKPLSAAQGVVLKGLIDALQTAVNGKAATSDLTSHTGNTTVHITATERTAWNKNTTDISNLSGEIANQQTVLKQYIDEQLGVIENGTY